MFKKNQDSLYITLAVIIIVIGLFVYRAPAGKHSDIAPLAQNVAATSNPGFLTKEQILNIVSGGKPLSEEERKMIFVSIAGVKMTEFNFSAAERALIISSLNRE